MPTAGNRRSVPRDDHRAPRSWPPAFLPYYSTPIVTRQYRQAPPRQGPAIRSHAEDVVFGAERELGDVLGTVLADDENVVFAVSAGAGLALGDHDHRFHRHHH